MGKATVRDLRYNFRKIEARLRKGEEIEVHKRKTPIARLVPIPPKPTEYPDFAARAKRVFGPRKTKTTGTELVAEFRGEY